jgi:hypothetical protein
MSFNQNRTLLVLVTWFFVNRGRVDAAAVLDPLSNHSLTEFGMPAAHKRVSVGASCVLIIRVLLGSPIAHGKAVNSELTSKASVLGRVRKVLRQNGGLKGVLVVDFESIA